eukprot:6764470-Prymnesium_polylepis.1
MRSAGALRQRRARDQPPADVRADPGAAPDGQHPFPGGLLHRRQRSHRARHGRGGRCARADARTVSHPECGVGRLARGRGPLTADGELTGQTAHSRDERGRRTTTNGPTGTAHLT